MQNNYETPEIISFIQFLKINHFSWTIFIHVANSRPQFYTNLVHQVITSYHPFDIKKAFPLL